MRTARWLALLLAFGCPEDEAPGTPTPGDSEPPAAGTCADPDENPYAGTCVETFLAGCFDPAGACAVTPEGLGLEIAWANGATVAQRGLVTTLVASDGTECALGETTIGGGGCFSQTVYTRSSDGATQAWCTGADGALVVTCDDGTTLELTPEASARGQRCQYGGDAACTLE